jgi:hypothetical protein
MPFRPIISSLVGLAVFLTTLPAADPMPPAPPALPEGALLVAVVPDLRATLDRVQTAAAPVAGAMPAGTLAGLLGARIGDPGLVRLAPGPVVVVISEGTPLPGFLALVPSTDPAGVVAQAELQGLSAQAVGGRVAIGANPWDLDRVEAVAGRIDALAAGATADVRITVPVDRVVAAYGPMLLGIMQMGMAQASRQQPEMAAMAKMSMATMAAATLLLPDVGTVQTDLALEGTVLSMDQVVAPPAGGALAKALVAPPAALGVWPVPGDGIVAVTARYPASAMAGWVDDALGRLAKDPRTRDLAGGDMAGLLRQQMALATGQGAMVFSGTAALCQTGMAGHRDAVRIRALQGRLVTTMAAGPFGDFYRAVGMEMRWETDVRRIGDRPVDTFRILRSATAALPFPEVPPMDLVVERDRILWSQDPDRLDALVAGALPGRVLAAQGRFPGMDGWMDADPVGYMALTFAMQAEGNPMLEPMREALASVPAGEPVALGWRTAEGRAQVRVRMPLEPWYGLAAAFRTVVKPPRQTQDL